MSVKTPALNKGGEALCPDVPQEAGGRELNLLPIYQYFVASTKIFN